MITNHALKAFIPTINTAKAKQFYQDVLGLKLKSEDNFAIEFDANGTSLRVTAVKEFTPYPFTVLGWEVKNIETVIKNLTEKGVLFEKYSFLEQDEYCIWTAPGGTKVAWFKDTDGNLLSLDEKDA